MNELERWIATTLVNDEASTDDELIKHFITKGPMTHERAKFYVSQRNDALRFPLQFNLKLANEGESAIN